MLLPAIQDILSLAAEHGLSQRRLAKLSGHAACSPSAWKRGQLPSLRALSDFAEVFGGEVRVVVPDRRTLPIYLPKFLKGTRNAPQQPE